LRIVKAYGNTRQAFGKPLLAHQGWRWALADADIDLQAARLLTAEAAKAIDLKQDAQTAAARAKVFSTRMAQRHIAALMHAMGAEGLHDCHSFMRHLASAQVATLVDGSTEMLLERIAKEFKAA
jgi:alkylation response protein AidB-like acyl-CoA dehydrogenase